MEVVLIDCEDRGANAVVSKSGFRFCQRFIVTVGSLILPFFKQKLHTGIDGDFMKEIHERQLRCFVTRKIEDQFVRCEAKILTMFESKSVKDCYEEVFGEWTVDSFENKYLAKQSLALFIILDINQGDSVNNDLVNELIAFNRKIQNSEDSEELFKGREVLIESVPFGNKHFINSHSCGIVSNILGKNRCFILSDCPSVPGSEGSPIYLKKKNRTATPIGIVISTLTWWRGEWIGLTICINFFTLLNEIIFQNKVRYLPENSAAISSSLSEENFLLQVTCDKQWGTAILLSKSLGILVTNSHVLSKGRKVDLRWKNRTFSGEILYQTPPDSPCDLAFLKTDSENCDFMEDVQLAQTKATKGETVFAAGYSLFPQKIKATPMLSSGVISQVSPTMLKTTCCISPGASGGALIRPNRELLGIIVSNAKLMEKYQITFPRVNMCIPVYVIRDIIERFLQILDVKILKELEKLDVNLWKEWIILEGKL